MQTVALREVRSAARRPSTYWIRLASGGIAAAIVLMLMIQAEVGVFSGRTLFMISLGLGFFMCLLDAVRLGSTNIVEERVEGTLGLLLLTRLSGWELLFGKFAAIGFFSLQTLLAVTPVLGATLLLGGISALETLRALLALVVTLIFTLSTALVISARSRDPSKAMIGTFLILLIGAIVLSLKLPVTGWIGFVCQAFNPMTPIWKISDLSYSQFSLEYWTSILFTLGLAALMLWRASLKLAARFAYFEGAPRRQGSSPAAQKETPQSFTTISEEKAQRTARWFEGNPIEWLTLRHLGLRGRSALPICAALFVGVVMLLTNFLGLLIALIAFILFGFLYSAAATLTLARARQTGELELWLTTPLGIPNIIQGIIAVMRRAFVWPGIILLTSFLIVFYLRVVRPSLITIGISFPGGNPPPNTDWSFAYLIGSTTLSIVSLLFALPYVAMWISLRAKTPAQATVRTFLWMFICPWLVFCIPKSLFFIPVGLVASHSVRRGLKDFAAKRAR